MTLTQEQLQKYAEAGVKIRLQAIHSELNELATNFPHIVAGYVDPAFRQPVQQTIQRTLLPTGELQPEAPAKRIAVTPKYVAKPNGKAKIHHMQTPKFRAFASKRSKAWWRKKRRDEKAAAAAKAAKA